MGKLIADKYDAWEQKFTDRFNKLEANEEELNCIFIEIYGLQDDLPPEVKDKIVISNNYMSQSQILCKRKIVQ